MKKVYSTLFCLFLIATTSRAQDTIFWQDFEVDSISFMIFDYPSGIAGDTNYYNTDADGLGDGSTTGNRPGQWFLTYGYADVDSTNTVLGANSWTNDANNPVQNWLVLPPIQITDGASAMLSWKSAPFQTPYYCDGYKVVISTTTNDILSFTDTLFVAAEYESGAFSNGGNYANYTFSDGFVHGLDGTFIEWNPDGDDDVNVNSAGDSARNQGVLRPQSVSLANYDNQLVYIAFLHDSHDDNLISIDEILVTENTDPFFGVDNVTSEFVGAVYPNPANEFVNVTFDVNGYHNVHIDMVDNQGHTVFSTVANGYTQINTRNLASGVYFVKVRADEGSMVRKVVVTH